MQNTAILASVRRFQAQGRHAGRPQPAPGVRQQPPKRLQAAVVLVLGWRDVAAGGARTAGPRPPPAQPIAGVRDAGVVVRGAGALTRHEIPRPASHLAEEECCRLSAAVGGM